MLTNDDLDKVLRLAHLAVEDSEKAQYLAPMNDVLKRMKKLDDFDLSAVEPTATVYEGETPMREDIVVDFGDLTIEANAPDIEDNCFSVPKIIAT